MRQSDKTIIEYRTDYLDWVDVEKGLSNATQENYGRFLDRFFTWLQGNDLADLKPHQLSEDHIWNYRIFLARKADGRKNADGLSRATQQRYLIALRSLLSFFAHRDISSLPHDKVNLPKDDSGDEVRNLTLDQLKKLFSAPNTDTKTGLRDRAILETLFSTGLRISELTSLDKKQVANILEQPEPELSITGKGNKTRTVYFSDRAVRWLKKYINTRNDKHVALFISYRGPAGDSRRLTNRSIERRVKKYATKVGLPTNTTPHVLRHSFATNLLRKGVDIRVLQEFLGHGSITATQVYTHVTNQQLKEIHNEHQNNTLERD